MEYLSLILHLCCSCQQGLSHSRCCACQALCSALAKMCVRELRTEAPNTSVFYMAAVSLVAAIIGCFLPMAWGDTTSFKVPDRWFQWLLLVGIGEHLESPLFTIFCYLSFSKNSEQRQSH